MLFTEYILLCRLVWVFLKEAQLISMKYDLKIQGFPAGLKKVNRVLVQNVKFVVKW